MDLHQTPKYAQYMQLLNWNVEKLGGNLVYIRKIPLLGNIAKLQRPISSPTEEKIDKFTKKHKIAVFYLEPDHKNNSTYVVRTKYVSSTYHRFKLAKNTFLPSKTIHIDLARKEKQILAQIRKKTRYGIRLAEKHGVNVKESRDIDTFINLWQSSARKRGMWLSQKKEIKVLYQSFGPKAHILFALDSKFLIPDSKKQLKKVQTPNFVAGVLLVRTSNAMHYMYAFSTKEGNHLSAPTLLAWKAIKLAKKKGCKIFDFEGIYDERYSQTKSWKGFTKFKQGFGGKEITYPQTLVKYYNPIAKILRP